ncbi:polysaccharide pyruvyl transferase family protein [Candidatus Cyanaurora vandensis]|uniref:polysaccharide pyruvyl transferase family protein n=1 Tax=Candidatus Cyanaurora vandensis TaxID=2714958 RepID=UPI00257B65CE|nr:polysaccharide pyruvyl transferase family protein [Candidatus Cyanaurora vandensis]
MQILIEQSSYALDNMGDLAMLEVSVKRLKELWPGATLRVFTSAPERVAACFPQAQAFPIGGRATWFRPVLASKQLPKPVQGALAQWEWELKSRASPLVHPVLHQKLSLRNRPTQPLDEFITAVQNADLVLATGGGYIADAFADFASSVLGVMALGIQLKKPTAMLGQGLGPLTLPHLIAKARQVFPYLDLITLREQRAGLPLLAQFGRLPSSNLIVTGDDAIELVYPNRQETLGTGIGVNLRVAAYSGVNEQILNTVRQALQEVAQTLDAPLFPVPISRGHDSDPDSISQLLNGADGGLALDTPAKVIQQVGQCRVMMTGSYHGGVFALAQGVPLVALVKSAYYKDKFLGLAQQFQQGCEVLYMDDPDLKTKLVHTLIRLWQASPDHRPHLLQRAREQMEASQQAYQYLHDLVESR